MNTIFDCTTLAHWQGPPTGIQQVVGEVGKTFTKDKTDIMPAVLNDHSEWMRYDFATSRNTSCPKGKKYQRVITIGSDWDYPEHHARLVKLEKFTNDMLLLQI